jgi:hypothetical protein
VLRDDPRWRTSEDLAAALPLADGEKRPSAKTVGRALTALNAAGAVEEGKDGLKIIWRALSQTNPNP